MIIGGVFILIALIGIISTIILSSLATQRLGIPSEFPYLDLIYFSFNLIYSIIFIVCISRPRYSLFKISISFIIIDIIALIIFLFIGHQDIVANIISIIINLCILWYFMKLKTYFVTGQINKDDLGIKKIDKKFLTIFVILIILSFLVPFIIGLISGVQKSSSMTQFLKEFQGKTGQQVVGYCISLPSDQKEECLIYLISISRGDKDFKILKNSDPLDINTCELFDKEYGKVSCYAIMNRCELVKEEKMHNFCNLSAEKFQVQVDAVNKR